MATVLVLYGTTEGHTKKIADAIDLQLRELGHVPVLADSAAGAKRLEEFGADAAVVCGSVHQGKHQAELVGWIRENVADLERSPAALVSVSLAASVPDESSRTQAREYVDELLRETGWRPDEVHLAAGALLYTEYDFFKRFLMKLIVRSRGGDTDTSRDYEYTDWDALRDFVAGFLNRAHLAERRSGTAR